MFFGLGGRGRSRGPRKGKDVVHQLAVSLEDLYNGSVRKLALQKNVICSKCDGKSGFVYTSRMRMLSNVVHNPTTQKHDQWHFFVNLSLEYLKLTAGSLLSGHSVRFRCHSPIRVANSKIHFPKHKFNYPESTSQKNYQTNLDY